MPLTTFRTAPEPGFPEGRIVDPDGNDLDPSVVLPQIDRAIKELEQKKLDVVALWAELFPPEEKPKKTGKPQEEPPTE